MSLYQKNCVDWGSGLKGTGFTLQPLKKFVFTYLNLYVSVGEGFFDDQSCFSLA